MIAKDQNELKSDRSGSTADAPRRSAGRCFIVTQMREEGFSGVQVHTATVKNLFRNAGWSTEVITSFSGRYALRSAAYALRYAVKPLSKQAAIFWLRYGHNIYVRAALKKALHASPEGAVLYAQEPLSAESALAVRRKGLDKVVLVIHFNDSQASEWSARGEIPKDGWVYRQIERFERKILPAVDEVVYVSDYMKRRLEAQIPGLREVPSLIIPNFVEPPTPAPEARCADILAIGTLEKRKNQAYILRVLAELHRRNLPLTATILGDGESRARLEELARELGLKDSVYFGGYVPNAAGWLYRHTLLAHAAFLENCPVSLIEALAAGVPVVAAAVGGIPELVDASTGAVWNLDSVSDGADSIQSLLESPTKLEAARESGRRRYRESFSPESAGARLVRNFSELLS